ncbi:hypothetical protein [Metabacillus sp. SLBN-84]
MEEQKHCPKCKCEQQHEDSKCLVCGHSVMDSILALYPDKPLRTSSRRRPVKSSLFK